MKVINDNGDVDLRGKSFVLVVGDGDDAVVCFSGSPHRVGQLLDAAVRATIDEKNAQQAS